MVCGPVLPVEETAALWSGHLYPELTARGNPNKSRNVSSESMKEWRISLPLQPHLHVNSSGVKYFRSLHQGCNVRTSSSCQCRGGQAQGKGGTAVYRGFQGEVESPQPAPPRRAEYTGLMVDSKDIKPIRLASKGATDVVANYQDKTLVYLAIPKCASSSMKTYLRRSNAREIKRDQILKHEDRVTIVRHPVRRLISAYHFGWTHPHKINIPTFEEWWDVVKQNPAWDVHTQPTVELLDGGNLATEIRQLEQIDEWWGAWAAKWPWCFKYGPLLKQNVRRFEPVSIGPALEEEVMEKYAEDYALWRSAAI